MGSDAPFSHPADWPVVSLADITLKIGSGATPRGGADTYLPKRIHFALIRSQNVFDRRFDSNGLAFISDEQAQGLKGVVLQSKDVLLNITGDGITFGRACMVPDNVLPACVNQHVSIVRVDPSKADSGYILSFLTHPEIKPYIESFNSGGSRRAITKGHIESFKLALPPLNEQRAIAHILGSLDDKIELNRRMNETLEAMAQALFKSWFIDFDPVIDNALATGNPIPEELQPRAAIRESLGDARKPLPDHIRNLFPSEFELTEEMGWVPKGWDVKSLDELVELIGGGTPKTSVAEYWGGDVPWFSVVDSPNISDVFVIDTEKHITQLGVEKSSTKILPIGTTIISARGTVGKCALVGEEMAMNQSCYGVRGKTGVSDSFVYYVIREKVADLQRSGHGSVFNTITRDTFKTIRMPFGGDLLTQKLEERIRPLFVRILSNCAHVKDLALLRDTLLPKLLSGEIRITDAEKLVGVAA